MTKELEALERALATLEMFFQSIVFNNQDEATALRNRLMRIERRVRALTELCTPEDQS